MPTRDRKRPFWSKWVWKDWDVKTRDLSPYEYTAYHRLLSYAATCSDDLCSIPDDDVRLARASGLGLRRWRSVSERVLSFFDVSETPGGGRKISHHRLREDAARFLQLVANPPSRVNGSGPEMAPARPPRARGSEVRSKKEPKTSPSPPEPRGSRPAPFDAVGVDLPEFVSREDWVAFVEHRSSRGKRFRLSERATKLALAKLSEFHAMGLDPNASLRDSVIGGYQGLFPPKPSHNGHPRTEEDPIWSQLGPWKDEK